MNLNDGYYEQLPDCILDEHYGSFAACEGQWNAMSEDLLQRMITAARGFYESFGNDVPAPCESWDTAKEFLETGAVLKLPYGYVRKVTEQQKCALCGKSIPDGLAAISRFNADCLLCSDCGTKEALQQLFGIAGD